MSEAPPRFLTGSPGEPEEAQRRWRVSCQWKRENKISHILQERQPLFYTIKAAYKLYLHKTDKVRTWHRPCLVCVAYGCAQV